MTYPEIEPYERGELAVGDGNLIYWETCGNPNGKPALFLHGGPGAGCTPGARRYFDPAAYRIVLFDQRGCGRSEPLVSERSHLAYNTTAHLIGDIEALREHLHVDAWVVLGVSWGSTLALAYAQAHPDRVAGLVLASVTTTSRREVEWITRDVGRLFPEQWQRFSSHVPDSHRNVPIVDAFAALLFHEDASVSAQAAEAWCEWEDSHISFVPGFAPNQRYNNAAFRLRFARIVTHYWKHAAFLEEDHLMRNVAALHGIPGILIHGRYDVSTPLETAWHLNQRWPGSQLHVVANAGHGGGSFSDRIVAALDRLKDAP